MTSISGYKILDQIDETDQSFVYRGIRESDRTPVIIKVLKEDYPTPAQITSYKQEYHITSSLNLPGVIKSYSLETYQDKLAIILEDFPGESLKKLLTQQIFSLTEFLDIAIKISGVLGHIHAVNIIHKDINPSNILYDQKNQEIKIIDFGISSILPRSQPSIKNPDLLEGTLAYISPEQTGRMNRSLDYRTDFYSLGVTFYQILTNKLPFTTQDTLELVYSHIAKQPLPPSHINPEIPGIIDQIVMKLLAKNAEDRYQSAWGLKADLILALMQLEAHGGIEYFILGESDIPLQFQIPQKLYGREEEIQTLLSAFKRVITNNDNQKEMMLLLGDSGLGKSALIQEMYKMIMGEKGYFVSGKFAQYQRNIPYSALINALQELVKQILIENETKLQEWKTKILKALGQQGSIIIDVIPEVELIIGSQPSVPELDPKETENRFNLVFQKFINVFCHQDHPLVIFLDDLQWIDSATLKLLQVIMTDNQNKYLFLICAYQENEVNANHPLIFTFDNLIKSGTIINKIILEPLKLVHITQLIAETLYQDVHKVESLAELVLEKTAGNPFFVHEFLKSLYQENLIKFNFDLIRWEWNIQQIHSRNITDNVVELMINRLKKLPIPAQEILQFSACLGTNFNLNTLSLICHQSPQDIFAQLKIALEIGLILPTSELNTELLIDDYKFLHNRVQQAAYTLISDEEKSVIHLQIGRLLLANTPPEELTGKLFEIVEHFNFCLELITEEKEKYEIIKLNIKASEKAKFSTAYNAAQIYLKSAMELLPNNSWDKEYILTFALYRKTAEIEYLTANFAESEKLIHLALEYAKTPAEKGELYNLLIIQYTFKSENEKAIEAGKTALKLLGVTLPEGDYMQALYQEYQEIKTSLGDRTISSLIDLPDMTDKEKKVVMKILNYLVPPTFMSCQPLFFVIDSKAVNLSLKYGNIPESAYMYACYGILQCTIWQAHKIGYELGMLGLKLSEKYNNLVQKTLVLEVLVGHLSHWRNHLNLSYDLTQNAYHTGLESGEIQFVSYTFLYQCYNRFYAGYNLHQYAEELNQYLIFAQQIKNQIAIDVILGCQLTIANLSGINHNLEVDEITHLTQCKERKSTLFIAPYLILKAQICYLFEQFTEAWEYVEAAEKLLGDIPGVICISEHNFYYSLILIALYPQVSAKKQKKYLAKVAENQERLKLWAANCPENFEHKYLLIEAERSRILSKELDFTVMNLYDQAINSAQKNGFTQNQALAQKLAGQFWLSHNKPEFAAIYLQNAHYNYQIWGGDRQVIHLEKKYKKLLIKNQNFLINNHTTNTNFMQQLDLATVMKASQVISGEIFFDKLLSSLMKTLIESAGAQLGYLILPKNEEMLIEAAGNTEKITVLQSIKITNNLPETVINYVIRTQETLVENDAYSQGKFTNDPYIKNQKSKSILCAPLLKQGQVIGIIYLENNLITGAFTQDRLEVIKLLSSQAAISIENAQLYANLETKVEERTQELKQTLTHLQATQQELIQSEKMAALGQLIAGVAHEINTPLGAIRSSIENIADFLDKNIFNLPEFFQQIPAEYQEYFLALLQAVQPVSNLSTKEKRQFKRALIKQLEAEEIDDYDTIADILVDLGIYEDVTAFLPLLKIKNSIDIVNIAYQLASLQKSSATIKTATDRAAKIVFALKNYARYDHSGNPMLFKITEGIETVLILYQNQLKQGVEISKNYGENLPDVMGYPDELNQVWTNLIHNSLQAMKNKGNLMIDVQKQAENIAISITDSGTGIPPEILPRIFEPFFTTKPPGEGSGLGLDIVKKIIDKHCGKISVESSPGQTTFTVLIPINSDQ